MRQFIKGFLLIGGFTVTACSGDGDDKGGGPATPGPAATGAPTTTPATQPPALGDKARVRVVHASPDAPRVDVYAKGVDKPLLQGIGFGETSAYLDVPVGAYTLELRASPSTPADPAAYVTPSLTLDKDAKITAVAAGLLSSKESASAFRVLPLAEKFDSSTKGRALVRILHAGADAPTVGIDVGNDDPLAPEITALTRFQDTGAPGVPLPAGLPLQIGIAAGGQTVTAFSTTALPEGGEVFVIATGLLAKAPRLGDGFSLLAVGPNGTLGFIKQNPVVYALHASPDAPAVDLFAGTEKLVDNLAFGKIARPVQVPPGSYPLDIYGHTDGKKPTTPPVATKTVGPLEAGARVLAIATGFLSPNGQEPPLRIDAFADELAVDNPTSAQIRAIHASPDAPAVDIGIVSGPAVTPVLFKDLTFSNGSAKEGLSIAPSSVRLGVTPTGNGTNIAARFDVTTVAGSRMFAVATGALGQFRGQGFRLLFVDTVATPWSVTAVHPTH